MPLHYPAVQEGRLRGDAGVARRLTPPPRVRPPRRRRPPRQAGVRHGRVSSGPTSTD
ncbi:hypothetical protein HU200_066930 [Digitaria exilis]|uniref:Uncharacterized protein n=1 Tax=Digitaria exilis TaxID=1010633 RepID=A0A835A0A2_9POAL|nr:hypothetical protein HU200_066930 [Digitaria exilis]